MKKTAVVFGSSAAYAIGCCVNIMALEKKSPDLADKYIIYYDGWDENLLKKLREFSDKVELIEFTQEMYEKKYVDDEIKDNKTLLNFMQRYSHFSNLHSEYLLLLDDYNQVIYIEPDFIVLDDVSELKDINTVAWRGGVSTDKYKGVDLDWPNGGFFIFPDTIPYKDISSKYLEYFLSTGASGGAVSGASERAMDRLMYDFNVEVTYLSGDYNYAAPVAKFLKTKRIKLFHSAGKEKIWNCEFLRCLFPEYIEYLDYFDYSYTRQDYEALYSRDDFIISMLMWRSVLAIPKIDVFNSYVHLNPQNGDMKYSYKNYVNLFFRVKRIAKDTFRMYFHVNEERKIKLTEYINNSKKCKAIMQKEYLFFAYSDNSKGFYHDCSREELTQEFNKMISIFTPIIDDYFSQEDSALRGV